MSKPHVTTESMVGLLMTMLRPEQSERLRGARVAAEKGGAPPCECGQCVICLWQYMTDVEGTLREAAERAAGENHNFRQTIASLQTLGREALRRHDISLTTTKDGVTTPLAEPELDHIIRGLDKYAAHASEIVKRAEQVDVDSKAAVRGYHETTRLAIEERDKLEKTARGLSAQYEACMALAIDALHYADPGALPKDTKLTTLIGRLSSQRDTALSREIALRLFIEGHADYMTGPDVDALRVDVKTRGGTIVTYEGQELRNLVLTVVAKVSEAWALPGSPSARLIQDSRAAKFNAKRVADLNEWLRPYLASVPLTVPEGGFASPIDAARELILWLTNRVAVDPPRPTEQEVGAFPPVETPVAVEGTVHAKLAHLKSHATAHAGPTAPGAPILEEPL
jgi:hypothetical protein